MPLPISEQKSMAKKFDNDQRNLYLFKFPVRYDTVHNITNKFIQ